MIAKVTLPPGTAKIKYGSATLLPNADDTIDVPVYVAKTLCAVAGVSCIAPVTDTIPNYLSAGAQFEANYMLIACNAKGWELSDDKIAMALTSFAANGEPSVSLG